MAFSRVGNSCVRYFSPLCRRHFARDVIMRRNFSNNSYHRFSKEGKWVWPALAISATFGTVGVYTTWRSRDNVEFSLLPQVSANEGKDKEKEPEKLSRYERRYKDFSSVMYNGTMFMTPRDFLESIIHDEPRSTSFQVLDDRLLQSALRSVPNLSKGNTHMWRALWNDGILSYPDYLFLINALIKPRRQFEIVFKMIDVDGNDTIDIEEFDMMQRAVTRKRENVALSSFEQCNNIRSSLTTHLFGPKSNKKITSSDLFHFIDNLQTELREMEFQKYSLGGPTITPFQFAEIILRHTNFDLQDINERLSSDDPELPSEGINFQQYDDFCQLLNALDDFAVAMTMYTIAGMSLSEDEFARASKVSIGKSLDPAVIHTVFKIFDRDGDGKLSYKEFLSVMKNWQVRGMKIQQKKREGIWSEFKTCVKLEMRNQ